MKKLPQHVDHPIDAEACNAPKEYTKVTFFPDFSRFGMTALDRDHRWLAKNVTPGMFFWVPELRKLKCIDCIDIQTI